MVSRSNFDQLLGEFLEEITADAADDNEGARGKSEMDAIDTAIFRILKKMSATLVAQGRAIRELQAGPAALNGNRPAPLAKALRGGKSVPGEEFLAKAMDAQAAGRITGHDVAIAEQLINAGRQPPAEIVRAVVGA